MRTRVKICGITRIEDAHSAIIAGADALGFVFYSPSPRALTYAQAADIVHSLPPFVTSVGLFVNASAQEVNECLRTVPLSCLQFHGDETAEFCASFNRPWIKALRMRPNLDLKASILPYLQATPLSACGILVDAYTPGTPGGTGETFDWRRIPADLPCPLILAGGLNCDNIERAIQRVRPYAVDVSGGVEIDKGIKDPEKIHAFIRGVSSAQ
ncbi:phosphoribosylanthranilate isomerase [Allopseudospirillum japonicum]|uniref:N-(5'-phosphoribosyl)anthranilate isomerase n=1 Tax=Allopseudospirillum japonicum TaxID=64971 RepID=A0A1H6SLK9_9GAMM|nr:phosphoribosylanthranilate isomerase [Allopseudospirillum japonicum]SEI68779.1 phosphoribosylanthranilate isomerase [Allopseudospirillum japonicum]